MCAPVSAVGRQKWGGAAAPVMEQALDCVCAGVCYLQTFAIREADLGRLCI